MNESTNSSFFIIEQMTLSRYQETDNSVITRQLRLLPRTRHKHSKPPEKLLRTQTLKTSAQDNCTLWPIPDLQHHKSNIVVANTDNSETLFTYYRIVSNIHISLLCSVTLPKKNHLNLCCFHYKTATNIYCKHHIWDK